MGVVQSRRHTWRSRSIWDRRAARRALSCSNRSTSSTAAWLLSAAARALTASACMASTSSCIISTYNRCTGICFALPLSFCSADQSIYSFTCCLVTSSWPVTDTSQRHRNYTVIRMANTHDFCNDNHLPTTTDVTSTLPLTWNSTYLRYAYTCLQLPNRYMASFSKQASLCWYQDSNNHVIIEPNSGAMQGCQPRAKLVCCMTGAECMTAQLPTIIMLHVDTPMRQTDFCDGCTDRHTDGQTDRQATETESTHRSCRLPCGWQQQQLQEELPPAGFAERRPYPRQPAEPCTLLVPPPAGIKTLLALIHTTVLC